MGLSKELKNFFRRSRREGSGRAATNGLPSSSANSRQEESVDVPTVTDSIQEVPPKSPKNPHSELGSNPMIDSTDKVPPTQEGNQSNTNPGPVDDAKALKDPILSPSDSKSKTVVDPSKTNDDPAARKARGSIDEETREAHFSRPFQEKSSNRLPLASGEASHLSKPLWSPERYSQKLWDLAYNLLKQDNGEIVKQYESAILAYVRSAEQNLQNHGFGFLSSIIQSSKAKGSDVNHEWTSRSFFMVKFLELYFQRPITSKGSDNSLENDTSSNADETESEEAFRIMSELHEAIQTCSHAYIPWVAACFAIEWLLHKENSRQVHASTISITCSMGYYIGLSNLLFKSEENPSSMPDEGSEEWSLLRLYQAILAHQIQSGISDLEQDLEHPFVSGSAYDSILVSCEQEIKDKHKHFMSFNMQEVEIKLTSWLDRVTDKKLEEPDVDGSSQQSSQQDDVDGRSQHNTADDGEVSDGSSQRNSQPNDIWETWDGAQQSGPDLDNPASRPFHELYGLLQKTTKFQDFVSWSNEHRGRVLLLDTDLGTGNTDLLRVLSMNLSKSHDEDAPSAVNVVMFAPDSCSPNRNNFAFLLRSLIFHVLKQQPSLRAPDTEKKRFDEPADYNALKLMFYSLLRDDNFQPTYFIIDTMEASAIDNTDAPTSEQNLTTRKSAHEFEVKDLLNMIAATIEESPKTRWLVNGIVSSSDLGNCYNRISIKTDTNEVSEILARYSASRVSEMAQGRSHENSVDTREIYEAMQQPPHHNLLWINTALDIAKRDPAYWNAPTTFQGLIETAPNMNHLYGKVKQDIDKLRENDKQYCLSVLSTLAFAYRPLSLSELRDLVRLPVEISLTVLIEEFLCMFLKISEISGKKSIDFVHTSAKEFIRSRSSPPNISNHDKAFSNYHEILAARCLDTLMSSFSSYDDTPSTDDTSQEAPLFNKYAMIFWVRHLLQMGQNVEGRINEAVNDVVTAFRTQWLKVMGSYGVLREALVMINDGEFAIEAATKSIIEDTKKVHRMIRETGEFIRVHLEWTETLRHDSSDNSYSEATVSNSFVFWPSMRPSWLAQAPAWDIRTHISKSCLQVMEHSDWVRGCAFSPCGRLVATGADDHSIRLWDTASGSFQHVLGNVGGFVYSLATTRPGTSGQPLLAASSSSVIKLWNLSTGRLIKELKAIENVVQSKIETEPRKAVKFEDRVDDAASHGDEVERTDQASEANDSSSTEAGSNFLVEKIDISPRGDYLVALVNDSLFLWETSNFKCTKLHELDGDKNLNSVRFSPDGQHLAAGVGSGIITCDVPTGQWESRKPTKIDWLPAETPSNPEDHSGHSDSIFGLCYSPDSGGRGLLASGSDDGTARIWNLETRKTDVVFKYHKGDVNSVSFSADGLYLATASSDNTIGIWYQVSPGNWGSRTRHQPDQVLIGHSSMIWSVNFAPQGHRLVSCGNDSQALVWEIEPSSLKPSGLQLEDEPKNQISMSVEGPGVGHISGVTCVSVSPDGTVIASGCSKGQICLWDGATGAHVLTMTDAHVHTVISIVFSADGETLISTSSDESALVWSVNGTDKKATLVGHDDWVRGAAISSDKRLVATACDDRAVRVYDIRVALDPPSDAEDSSSRSIEPWVLFKGHGDYVYSVAFSPDGQYLVSAGDDGIVMFWDLNTQGHKERPDKKLDDQASCWWRGIVFTPDGNSVLTVSNLGVVAMWKANLEPTEEGQCLAICREAETFESMRINPDQPDVLITNAGAWEFNVHVGEEETSGTEGSVLQLRRRQSSLGISDDDRWITWDDDNLILLPLKFRPTSDRSSRWVQSRYVIIGCMSGQVLLFKLAEGATPAIPTAK